MLGLSGSLDVMVAGIALAKYAPDHRMKLAGGGLVALGAAGVACSGYGMRAANRKAREICRLIAEAPSTRYFKNLGIDLAKVVQEGMYHATTQGMIAFGQNASAVTIAALAQTIPSTPVKAAYAAVGVAAISETLGLGRRQFKSARLDMERAFGGAGDIVFGFMPEGGEAQYLIPKPAQPAKQMLQFTSS